MILEIKELIINGKLRKKVDIICRFTCIKYELFNTSILNIKNTNIAYTQTHILEVNNDEYLLFDECDGIFINGQQNKIKFKDLEEYLKEKD